MVKIKNIGIKFCCTQNNFSKTHFLYTWSTMYTEYICNYTFGTLQLCLTVIQTCMNACLQHKIYQAAVLLQLVSLQNNIILPSKTELCLMLKVTHTCFLFWLTFYSQIFSLLVSVDLLHCTAASNYYLLFSLLPLYLWFSTFFFYLLLLKLDQPWSHQAFGFTIQ